MCGILLLASGLALEGSGEGPKAARPCPADFAEGLRCRGPDNQGHVQEGQVLPPLQSLQAHCGPAALQFYGSLLQLRGTAPSSSPLTDAAGNVLLFNGQLFGGGVAVPPGSSDAAALLAALGRPGADVAAVLSSLRGPWALVFWHAAARTLWFGRDPIGRRSLLLHLPRAEDGRLILSSSAPLDPAVPFEGFSELPPGMYSFQLEQPCSSGSGSSSRRCGPDPTAAGLDGISSSGVSADGWGQGCKVRACYQRHEWAEASVRQLAAFRRAPQLVEPPTAENGAVAAAGAAGGAAEPAAAADFQAFEATVDEVMAALRQAVATRCHCIDQCQPQPPAEAAVPGGGEPACGISSQLQQARLDSRTPGSCTPGSSDRSDCTSGSAAPPSPPPLLPPAPVLVLFSGGVDSTLLAALAHEALPPGVPIDLASVCFAGGTSPDRLSALNALEELRELAPERQWRLIQARLVDCSMQDVVAARPRLLRLLAPADTVMDLNIGAALWLAARGEGTLLEQPREGQRAAPAAALASAAPPAAGPAAAVAAAALAGAAPPAAGPAAAVAAAALAGSAPPAAGPAAAAPPVRQDGARQQGGASPPTEQQQQQQHDGGCGLASGAATQRCRSAARVVLLGHGADELCGGYGRHRTAFRNGGWAGLADELQLDLGRLWLRNLGRDDRLVADHGREARHPFLDEGLVAATLAAPLWHLADLRLPPGQGDKRVLRACLARLGLHRAAGRAKRAIQFGSRLAARANEAFFGGTHRANLANAGSVRLSEVPLPQPE